MTPSDRLPPIRRLHLRARHAVENLLGGEYHSVFKGAGIAFEEVREYQPGDEVRSIDWNVTARQGRPFVKRYVEERERTLILVIDVSGSQAFGTRRQPKREIVAELAALLAFSALANHDRVGLLLVTDRVERFVPPRKGVRHGLRLIREVLFHRPRHRGTALKAALEFLVRTQRRRAIVFVISDFLDAGFERPFQLTGRKHDLIAVCVRDPAELSLPAVGFMDVHDCETGRRQLVDLDAAAIRAFHAESQRHRDALRQLARAADVDLIETDTTGGHLDALVRFFRARERHVRP